MLPRGGEDPKSSLATWQPEAPQWICFFTISHLIPSLLREHGCDTAITFEASLDPFVVGLVGMSPQGPACVLFQIFCEVLHPCP